MIKVIFFIGSLSLLYSCANVTNSAKDTDDCRKIAYGKSNKALTGSVNNIFLECQQKKELQRKAETQSKNTDAWIDFLSSFFDSNNDSN